MPPLAISGTRAARRAIEGAIRSMGVRARPGLAFEAEALHGADCGD